jgi:hypothetical protein
MGYLSVELSPFLLPEFSVGIDTVDTAEIPFLDTITPKLLYLKHELDL